MEELGKERINFEHPANSGILKYLGDSARLAQSEPIASSTSSCHPDEIEDLEDLGIHPDLILYLWKELGGTLSVDCRWVVFGTPTLVHPASGIIFAFAEGTFTRVFRLSPIDRRKALEGGATTIWEYPAYPELDIEASVLDLEKDVGEEWVFGGKGMEDKDLCLWAYNFAGEMKTD